MSYNLNKLPHYVKTAGKITILTSLLGVVVFAAVFLLNLGAKELKQAEAQSGLATTSITVLNTPPQWSKLAHEKFESSTSSPTNSGTSTVWEAIATDSNNESYYLLICSGSSSPTASTSGNAPSCGGTDRQWAISPYTSSTEWARAATVTIDSVVPVANNKFQEENRWFAWICDAVNVNPRCNATYATGTSGTNSEPFNVNSRPSFSLYDNNSPTDPGGTVTINATSSDPDTDPVQDDVRLYVCSTNSFNSTSSVGCNATTLASSTFSASDPQALYNLQSVMPDDDYYGYGYIVDEHGHPANTGFQGENATITVNNVAPTVPAAQIDLNNATSLILTNNATQTPGFDLRFSVSDANSCYQSDLATFEVTDYIVSVYRSGIGTSTASGCFGSTTASAASQYDPNNCYPSKAGAATWDISCTASSTSCTYDGVSDFDSTIIYDCTFPLWYVADPTDGTSTVSVYHTEDWRAAISGIDDDGVTTTNHTQSNSGRDLLGLLYLALDTLAIPYADREPGQYTDPLVATTTIRAEGNVGIDERLTGESMCGTYATNALCPNSATSTIPESEQVFATSSVSYAFASSSGNTLSSSTNKLLDINVQKPTTTSTSTNPTGVTYWGIRVPGAITRAGLYTGENTFFGVLSDPSQW